MELSIIIVNYNVKFFLEQCLYSVQAATKNIEGEIFVVDNNSVDGSREYLEEKFAGIKFIWNNKNIGFAKANNFALTHARGKYILFLNPDTIVPEDCFTKCIDFFEKHLECGALGVKMLDGSGKFLRESKRSFPTPIIAFYKLSGLSALFPKSKIFGKYHLGYLDPDKNHETDVLAGAFMMIPSAVLKKTGSFDESFFMYGEDVDLSYRIKKSGYKNYYFSETQIVHFKGESTRKGSLNYVRLFYSAMNRFVQKQYKGGGAGLLRIFIQSAIFLRAFLSAVGKFIRHIGMPVVDALLILFSFLFVRIFWGNYIRPEVIYEERLLFAVFPLFTIIYLSVAYYTGLYDKYFRQSQLNRSAAIATVTVLSVYALLPEGFRFSRGIILFGSLIAYLVLTFSRYLLIKWGVLEAASENGHNIIVIGTKEDENEIRGILKHSRIKRKVTGRITVLEKEENTIGHLTEAKHILSTLPVKKIISCLGPYFSFKQWISLLGQTQTNIKMMLHVKGSLGIIGSDSRDEAGEYVSMEKQINLLHPQNKRLKRLADVLVSVFFIITFPFHFFLQKKPGTFFKNCFSVLANRKTWVGYAVQRTHLPMLKISVLASNGLSHRLNFFSEESKKVSDEWYAREYRLFIDLKYIWKGYKYLGDNNGNTMYI